MTNPQPESIVCKHSFAIGFCRFCGEPDPTIKTLSKLADGRPTKDQMFLRMADLVKERSTCHRAHVGVIITNFDGTSVVSMGYNGNATGLPNTCDTAEPGLCGCIHAEVNALLKAPYQDHDMLILYSTTSPCINCAKLILNSRVRRMVYAIEYRYTAGRELLAAHGISVDHLPLEPGA